MKKYFLTNSGVDSYVIALTCTTDAHRFMYMTDKGLYIYDVKTYVNGVQIFLNVHIYVAVQNYVLVMHMT